MAIRRIIRMGHPLLREVAQPLDSNEIGGLEFNRLLTDMIDTLHDYGGIGLAAPQIGESVRIAIIEIPGGETRYGEIAPMSLAVFINPSINVVDPAIAGYWEGCLSVPGLRGYVERPQRIKVNYTNEHREQCEIELSGFPATVFQHEFDHLDGTLYVDRISDTRRLSFEHEYERYLLPQVDE